MPEVVKRGGTPYGGVQRKRGAYSSQEVLAEVLTMRSSDWKENDSLWKCDMWAGEVWFFFSTI